MSAVDPQPPIRLYEAKFRDAITHMLTTAISPDRSVEANVAEGLRKLFLAAPLHVVWETKAGAVAASCPDMRSPARTVVDRVRIDEILGLAEPLSTAYHHAPLRVFLTLTAAPVWGMVMISSEVHDAQLWLVVERPDAEPARDFIGWFSRYAQGQRELFTAVKALMALRAVQRDAENARLAQRVSEITSGGELIFAKALDAATDVVEEIARDRTPLDTRRTELVQDLAVWATQALLGIGWGARGGEWSRRREQIDAFCGRLDHIAARSQADGVGRPAEILCLSGILRATVPELAATDLVERTLPDGVAPALALLVTWTGLHELARRIDRYTRPPSPDDEQRWSRAVERSLPDLAALLEDESIAGTAEVNAVRNWARLWFCLVLLRASKDGRDWWQGTLLDDEKWRFRADVSYVLRESARMVVYGRRADFKYQPAAFAAALRTLVEQHALRVVGLPREHDIRTHLREIGTPLGAESYHFAAGHLQHVLEIYIGGHFLASLEIAGCSDEAGDSLDGWTVAEVLASRSGWRPGAQTTRELLQAFSLAALFHDTGMLLFPRVSLPGPALRRGDARVDECLGEVERAFRGAGADLIARCVEELRAADYLDATNEPGLARWLETQRASGRPDHALLGAWYLHRASQAIPGTTAEVHREALRAVLLHSLLAVTVDVERDPVAALLILCDELFEWEPFQRAGPDLEAVGRSLASLAADVRPHRSRIRSVELHGLSIERAADGGVVGRLRLNQADHALGWPRLSLRLQHPDRLEMPVHYVWLSMGQNLGRLQRSRHGWGPCVTVTSRIPGRLRAAGLTTQRLLAQVAAQSRHPARVGLERWIYDVATFHTDEERGEEELRIEAQDHLLYPDDIRREFAALDEDAERVAQQFERRLRA